MKNKNTNSILLFIVFVVVAFCFYACVKELKPLPQADFTYTTSASCILPMSVSFENLSQNADVYRWDFGDGTPVSHNKSPIHVFNTEGVYDVRLTAYGPGGTHETMLQVYVVTTPVSTFYTNDTLVEIGDTVHFFGETNSSLPSTWLWSFGDGYTSTLEDPEHVYSYTGTYTVVLTSTNACGATYVVQNNYVVVNNAGAPPIPDFTANVTTINEGGTVNFTDLSQNAPNAWEWTFDGGAPTVSNAQNPSNIIYNTAGVYDVKLKVYNTFGFDSIIKTTYINVIPSGTAPVADFVSNVNIITTGSSVNFTDLSINNPTSWQWQFPGGNPNTSTLQNPQNIVYNTPGVYQVSLTATNGLGSDTETKISYITVNPPVITQVQIKKIILENMPFPTMPPMFRNPYYQITTPANVVVRDGRNEHLSNIVFSMLPVSWDLTPFFSITVLNTQYKIRIWDWRMSQVNDIFVSEVLFNMINYTYPPTAYPPTITLMQNQTKITLELQWQ